ncbi:non-muscle cofilin 1-like isoform X2 [Sinocyclocheilus grahami]|uniref:Cofilin-2-like n=1 Tax=Sinocyclocheilus grahami TaxID=75366 RepID=A0A672MQG4_SINGR|nr:PREDICTED: cofilin-2-like isoform X1 [Sinocyclocheilus grahami]XP_016147977.1 PREDICTED: cofilin-2-like isoform X2 [Sinocyclocheilus grahami]
MASGVAISDEVVYHYNAIRVRQTGTEVGQRFKLVVMCLSKDQKSIVVDVENCLKVKDVGNSDVLKQILSKLPTNECRYALYDCSYASMESVKEDLVFILSAPENASLKSRMVYASSKAGLKAKMPGLKFEWQINEPADREASCLVEKLGGKVMVKSLEGIRVDQ